APALPCKRRCLEVPASFNYCRFAPKRLHKMERGWICQPHVSGFARQAGLPLLWSKNGPRAQAAYRHQKFDYFFANSNSIFFAAGSSLLILKLRICPAEEASGLAAMGEAPLFQRCCNTELSDPRSAAFATGNFSSFADASSTMRHAANTPSPNSTRAIPPETCTTRPVTTSPSLCSAMYSSRLEGTICLMLRRTFRFAPSTSSTWAFTVC